MLKEFLRNDVLGWLVRVGLGALFVWASADKIMHPDQFAKIVNNYQILPGEVINIFGITLPWLELLCGLALIAGVLVRPAAAWIGLLLVVFVVAVSLALSKGININCGCFSTSAHARGLGFGLLLQDLGMLLLALHAAVYDNRFLSVRRCVSSGG
jgi:uncharacterized membrane protein YphA (DoxX/SURF4 family)